MSQHDNPREPDSPTKDKAQPQRPKHGPIDYTAIDLEIYITPASRYRKRADGGMDESFRIQFAQPLTPEQMRDIANILLTMPEIGAEFGFTALTKLEFLEPDICDYRFWCAQYHSDRLVATWGLWQKIHRDVCAIYSVDGVRYSTLFKNDKKS